MRYTNWDILIFPETGDVKTSLQEFYTTCTVTQDPGKSLQVVSCNLLNLSTPDVPTIPSTIHPAYLSTVTRPLPTVSCYIPSLPHGTPFRVSLHSWSMPIATRATASMVTPESSVWFEARVLLDGICTAGTLFNQDPSWPQVIDSSSHVDKADAHAQIRFPPFHAEMLTQVWADAAQDLGRVKVIIAEGIRHSRGSCGFQRIKNLVTFSFQHAPLNILENCGIAWPNPGMWLQAQQQFQNTASPRNDPVDPGAHAHSPRWRDASMKIPFTRFDAGTAPPPNTYELMAQRGFQGHGLHSADSQIGSDPFIGGSSFNSRLFKNMTSRNTTSSGDVMMKSRSTSSSHDEPMPDVSRVHSPTTDRRCRSMLEAYAPGPMNFGNYDQNHSWQYEITGERNVNNSQFNEMMAAFSPRRKESALSGISAPSNTRASSAANTPPGPHTRPGTSAGSEAVSFEGHPCTVSVTTRDPPPPIARVPSNTIRSQSEARKTESRQSESRQSESHDNTMEKVEMTIKKKPVGRPRGRKEGRSSEQGLDITLNKPERKTSTGSVAANGKENTNEIDEKVGDSKRKRVSIKLGSNFTLKDRAENPDFLSPTRKVSKTGLQDDLSAKLGELDELTADGVGVRKPLEQLDNIL